MLLLLYAIEEQYSVVDLLRGIGLLICFINTRFTALMNFCVGIYFQNIQHLAVVVYVACYQRWPQANNDVTVKTLYWGHECDLSRSRDVIGHVTIR